MPIFARMEVSAANTEEASARINHICVAPFLFLTTVYHIFPLPTVMNSQKDGQFAVALSGGIADEMQNSTSVLSQRRMCCSSCCIRQRFCDCYREITALLPPDFSLVTRI